MLVDPAEKLVCSWFKGIRFLRFLFLGFAKHLEWLFSLVGLSVGRLSANQSDEADAISVSAASSNFKCDDDNETLENKLRAKTWNKQANWQCNREKTWHNWPRNDELKMHFNK